MVDVFQAPIKLDASPVSGLGCVLPKVHKVTVEHSDLTDADTAQDIDLATDDDGNSFPANARLLGCSSNTLIAFTGGGNTAVTLSVGDAGAPTELQTAVSVFTAGYDYAPGAATFGQLEATAYAPIGRFTSTTGTVAGLTAGKVEIYIHYWLPTNPRA
jgi:hypothetical protein